MAPQAFSHTNSKGVKYYLFTKEVELRGGRIQRIYWFQKDSTSSKGQAVEEIPAGMIAIENPRNGFITLKREK